MKEKCLIKIHFQERWIRDPAKQSSLRQQQQLLLLNKRVFIYIHKVFWNIPEAYIRTILVVLHNKYVT